MGAWVGACSMDWINKCGLVMGSACVSNGGGYICMYVSACLACLSCLLRRTEASDAPGREAWWEPSLALPWLEHR